MRAEAASDYPVGLAMYLRRNKGCYQPSGNHCTFNPTTHLKSILTSAAALNQFLAS